MAKTTTTKAKTKTTKKKPVAKAAAKTTKSTKTTSVKSKKTTVKATPKPVKTAAAKVTTKSSVSPFAVLQRAQVLTAALYAALAVAVGFLVNNFSAQVFIGHLTKDELASRAGTVLAPAAHVLYEVEIRWVLVGALVVAAVFALLRGTRYKALEDAGVKARVQPLRWLEIGVTTAVLFAVAALLNGLQDGVALKLSMALILLGAYFAWMFERENAANGKPAKSVYLASTVSFALPVVMLATTMYSTYVYGMVRSPWYAYAAAAVVSFALLLTTRMQWNSYKKQNGTHDYIFVDRNYNRLSVVTKVALALVVIIGLYAN